ncbi:kinase-like domain-containing protein [Tirmania nivea]|nr:kinase-like domain-containing protein [Tirmania nivea]
MSSSPIEAVADKFQVLEEIGSGSFGVVYKAIERETGKVVAIKHIDLEASEDDIVEIQQEISVLGTCASPHVTKYYGSFVKGYKLWIIMEYLGGGSGVDLLKPSPFSEPHIAAVCKEILLGLDYLHSEGKIHRDIKAANILFSSQGAVKLADFGVATQLSHMKSTRNTFVGTPFWMAPEVIQQSGYGFKADIWSLGITAMEFANGEPPHATIHPMKVLFMIPKEPAPRLTGPNFSPAFKDFVAQCLTKDPLKRPSARELLKHKFIRSAPKIEAIQELIERKERWGASSKAGRKSEEIKLYQKTVKAATKVERKYEESDDEESGWIFETMKQRETLVRKPPCEELRTIARKSSPSQQEATLKTINLNKEQRSERRKRASSGTRVVSGTMIRTKTPPSRMHTPPSRTRTPQSKPSTPRPRSNGPTLITPEMVFGKDGVRAFSGELDCPSPASRTKKDSGIGLTFGKPEKRESYEGIFQGAMSEVQSIHLPTHDQMVLAQLDNAWAQMALISPELENALMAKLIEKLQQLSNRPAPAPSPPPMTRLPLSPPRPLPTPPPAKLDKIIVGLPPPTPPAEESDKRQLPRREALRRAASDSSNQSSDSKPSLSGETVVDGGLSPIQIPCIPGTPHHVKSPKERKEKHKKRKSYVPTDVDALLEKERERERGRGKDREKDDIKEGKERRKRDSMHEHLTSYTEQLESMIYGQWLTRLGARWPLAHVGAGGGGK